jgi:hypothetical protein
MQDPHTLRWKLLELRIALMALEAQFDLGLLAQEVRRELRIESDDAAAGAFCDDMSSLAHRIDHCSDAIRYTEAVLWRTTTPLPDQLTVLFPSRSKYEVGVAALQNVIHERQFFEYADHDTFNPEGILRDELWKRLHHAETLMFFALDRLPDADVQTILDAHQDTDHDGSQFPIASLEDVRHRASALA